PPPAPHGNPPPGKSRGAGRSEEVGPFERSIALGEVLQMPFGNLFEQRERFVEISSGDARPAPLAPRLEERLERAVQQLPPLERREAGLVLTFFFELEDLAGEVLERTLQVALDAAHRVDDALARADRAVIPRIRVARGAAPPGGP